jgi:hypothetical protein
MYEPIGRCRAFLFTNNTPSFIDLDGLPGGLSGFFVTLEVPTMSNTTMVNEALGTREVISVTVDTNKLDHLTVRTFENARACLFFSLRIAIR